MAAWSTISVRPARRPHEPAGRTQRAQARAAGEEGRAAAPSADAKHRIRFARSGVELEWTPESGSILDLAEKNGVRIPTGCRVGQCESCFVGVVEGEAACAVANEDLEEGGCLTCQAIPLTDMTLDA